ncbi:uncharacterized protein [Palaemon carinicauda]|uniref:uncharacterized protein n=1 Tax=Palaemon carinicauda TaxID=392227 RepID=UPI0035B5DFF2
MILTFKGSPNPFASICKKDMYVKRRWRRAQFLADEFWRRWIKEYLSLLQKRQKWSVPKCDIDISDVVLTLNKRLPQSKWPLGKIIEVPRSTDGRVHQALIKADNGEFKRPMQKLYPHLEKDKGDDIK